MQQTNRVDQTDSVDPSVILNAPLAGIDLRRILLAVRSEIPHRKLLFSSGQRADVFVPTLREKFKLIPYKDFLVIKARKTIKIPMLMDGPMLSIKIIDVVVAWIEHQGINDKISNEL